MQLPKIINSDWKVTLSKRGNRRDIHTDGGVTEQGRSRMLYNKKRKTERYKNARTKVTKNNIRMGEDGKLAGDTVIDKTSLRRRL